MENIKILMIITLAVFLSVLFYLMINDYGVRKENLEADARDSHNIPLDWSVAIDTSEGIGAMLFYNNTLDDYSFSVYTTQYSKFGKYQFIHGGIITEIGTGVIEILYPESGKVIFSMNRKKIKMIELSNKNNKVTMEIDSEIPFVIVVPSEFTSYILMDINNEIISIDYEQIY